MMGEFFMHLMAIVGFYWTGYHVCEWWLKQTRGEVICDQGHSHPSKDGP